MKKNEAQKIIRLLVKKSGKNPAVEVILEDGARTIGYFRGFISDTCIILGTNNKRKKNKIISLNRIASITEPTMDSAITLIRSYEEEIFQAIKAVGDVGCRIYPFDTMYNS